MKIHHTDDVGAPGFEGERFDFARSVAVGVERVRGVGQAGSVGNNLAHAIDGLQEIPGFDPARRGRGERKVAAVLEDALQRCGGGQETRPAVILMQSDERLTDGGAGGGPGIRVRL